MINNKYYICTVCNKQWGVVIEGADVELTKCEKHLKTLTTAEIYAKGMTPGNYVKQERLALIRGGKRLNGQSVCKQGQITRRTASALGEEGC